MKYGKRKTWIITTQIISSLLIIISSFITEQKLELLFALSCFLIIFFICLQDIALVALAIKQLKSPMIAAMLQVIFQNSGNIIGGLLLLKLTLKQFAEQIGLKEAITTPMIYLIGVGLFLLIPAILIHFGFREQILESQLKVNKKSFR